MIQSASLLAMTLQDYSRAAQLEYLFLQIEIRISDMELNKNFLENKLDEQLQAICEQRAKLDRMEKEANSNNFKRRSGIQVTHWDFLRIVNEEAFRANDSKLADTRNTIGWNDIGSDENAILTTAAKELVRTILFTLDLRCAASSTAVVILIDGSKRSRSTLSDAIIKGLAL